MPADARCRCEHRHKAQATDRPADWRATHKRLVVVGGAGSLNYPDGRHVVDTLPAAYQGEARAMRNFLDTLKTTDINWTFFSPAFSIAPGTRTDKFRIGTTTLLTDDKGVTELETPAHERAQMTIAY